MNILVKHIIFIVDNTSIKLFLLSAIDIVCVRNIVFGIPEYVVNIYIMFIVMNATQNMQKHIYKTTQR